MTVSPNDASELIAIINSVVTPHDQFQDAALILIGLVNIINSAALFLHLRDHRKGYWMADPSRKDKR